MVKVSQNYRVEELIHPAIIHTYGEARVAKYLKVYSPLLVEGQQRLREFVDAPCVVNDYHWDPDYKAGGWPAIKDKKGLFINSGLRDLRNPLGKGFSGHYFMCATDTKQDKYSAQGLQNLILELQDHHPYIVRMEIASATPSWNHCQFGHRFPGQLIDVFNP